jgi:exosome complex exonuclease RRP6
MTEKMDTDNSIVRSSRDSGELDPLLVLITSLAEGVRAASELPKGKNDEFANDKDKKKDDEDDDDDDEFSFQMAFLEFRTLITQARRRIATIVNDALKVVLLGTDTKEEVVRESDGTRDIVTNLYSSQLSRLISQRSEIENKNQPKENNKEVDWEKCKEMCDLLWEEIEQYIRSTQSTASSRGMANMNTNNKQHPQQQQQQHKFHTIISKICTMEKSQITHHFSKDICTVINSRTIPFQPKLTTKPFAILPLDLNTTIPGHGIPSCTKKLSKEAGGDEDEHYLVAPKVHHPHPYETEINQFVPRAWQLQLPNLISQESKHPAQQNSSSSSSLSGSLLPPFTLIDTEDALTQFVSEIKKHQIREIAVDLEAHSYRSFLGFVCLMQLTVRWPTSDHTICKDILIDTLALRQSIGPKLLPIFVNPDICKIMHGADSDVVWLQRDFGIYVVNLFDTHQAAIELSLPSRSLASLLQRYAHVTVDKAHQLSDWRQRPLPAEMLQYAQSDTHYLIDIYDAMRRDLMKRSATAGDTTSSVIHVLDQSRQICLRRCTNEPFYPQGWKSLLLLNAKNSKKGHTQRQVQLHLNQQQQQCLSMLWDWRDSTARKHDESTAYVCPNHVLVKIAQRLPKSLSELVRLVNPIPDLIKTYSSEIVDFVQQSSRPYVVDSKVSTLTSKGISPIQSRAGTPDEVQVQYDDVPLNTIPIPLAVSQSLQFIPPGSDDDESDSQLHEVIPIAKRRRTLETHPLNANFICTKYTPHSLELSSMQDQGRGVYVDGAIQITKDSIKDETFAKDKMQSIIISNRIRSSLEVHKNLFNLVLPSTNFSSLNPLKDAEKPVSVSCDINDVITPPSLDDEIPVSLNEAYNVSNLKAKRSSSPSYSVDMKRRQRDTVDVQESKVHQPTAKRKTDPSSVIEPYDYSKTKSMGLLTDNSTGASLSSNPFFAGVAASLSTHELSITQKQAGTVTKEKRERKSSNYIDRAPKSSSEKSFVYRSEGR